MNDEDDVSENAWEIISKENLYCKIHNFQFWYNFIFSRMNPFWLSEPEEKRFKLVWHDFVKQE